jgi:RecB family exonuclease
MELRSLSASSLQAFECPARWKAKYVERAKEVSGSPAALGTVCHETLEEFVVMGHHLAPKGQAGIMETLFAKYWDIHFDDRERYDEGLAMCQKWRLRQEWDGKKVISTEQHSTFPLPTSQGEIDFIYIWDRCDELDDGSIDIVDYKSWMKPAQPAELKDSIQIRMYSLAARIQFPDAPRRWLTLDQLRYDIVATRFSRDEDAEAWKWLRDKAEEIIASDGTKEVLNSTCRYCVRKSKCELLQAHAKVGGPLGITDPKEAGEMRHRLEIVNKTILNQIEELDGVISDHMERHELTEYSTDGATDGDELLPEVIVSLAVSSRKSISAQMFARELPANTVTEFGVKFGAVTMGNVNKAIRAGWFSGKNQAIVEGLIQKTHGSPRVKTKGDLLSTKMV